MRVCKGSFPFFGYIRAMNIWLISATQYADDGTLWAVMLAQVEKGTWKVIQKSNLVTVDKVIKLIRDGKLVLAIWPEADRDKTLGVQVVPLPGGGETLETISQGDASDRRMDQLMSVDDMLKLAGNTGPAKH